MTIMDSRTHVILASQLLRLCGGRPALQIVSLFPQIDRSPPTLHRMYAHSVFKAGSITDIGLKLLGNASPKIVSAQSDDPDTQFAVRRFGEERERILSYQGLHTWDETDELRDGDRDAAIMAYISHLYLDTYNQPTQPFAPDSVYCAGQWALWERLGEFRLALYTTPIIDELRDELFSKSIWNDEHSYSASILTQAMLSRICDFSQERIPVGLIATGMRAVGFERHTDYEIRSACDFLREFENCLFDLHVKHLGSKCVEHIAPVREVGIEAAAVTECAQI
jgi:hypothetical protein